MALIKSQYAADLAHEAIVLDLGDLRRQAASLREHAEQQARRIIDQAEAEARRLTGGAEKIGYDAGFARGQAAGIEAGREQGHAQALQQSSAAIQKLQDAWITAAQRWDEQRRAMLLEARQSLLTLALKLAEKIVRRVPAVDPSVVVDQVAEAIHHVAHPCDVSIRIHPEDRPLVEQAMPALIARMAAVQHATLIDDAAIAPGGCIVTYGRGQIDATLDTQLDRLVRMLMNDSASAEPPPSPGPLA